MTKSISKSIEIGGRTLVLETGHLASQAETAVTARYGDTMVMVTVCQSKPREDLDYFPLAVDYVERLYAGGRISTSRFIKRERLPSEEAVLTGRLVDRSIRPLFPKDFFNEVQVIITVLSVDSDNDPDILSIIAASAALSISSLPWKGPIGAVRVGFKEDNFFINPVNGEMQFSEMDLVISGTEKEAIMVEAAAQEIDEATLIKGLEFGLKELAPVIKLIKELQEEVGKEKMKILPAVLDENLEKEVRKYIGKNFLPQLENPETSSDESWDGRSLKSLEEAFAEKEISKKEIARIFKEEFRSYVRGEILKGGKRLDGRKSNEVRPLEIEVGVLPRTHGSAVFKRGQTQVLTVATLGSPSLEQLIEGMTGEETKRYMHHYNFPPFSTGEVRRLGPPARREIGHGNLAERALLPVVPSEDKFPYTIRVVSEVLSSSGSTSMGAACGSTLALMDAGVPISSPVSGVAMGLVSEGEKYTILTDIAYSEDANGDMDLKVAGTQKGITAIQMDLKLTGLKYEILAEAIQKAKEGRDFILSKMLEVMPASRSQISPYAPRIVVLHVEPEQIGEVIGPGGKMIRKIIAETQTAIDVDDDGSVTISGMDKDQLEKAVKWIEGLTRELEPGEIFEGEVKRILPFGAFVEVTPGKEGLVHVSQMRAGFVSDPSEIVKIGDKVKVRVAEVDAQGRLNLSMLFGEDIQKAQETRRSQRPSRPREYSRPAFSSRLMPPRRTPERFGGARDRFRRPPGR